MLKHTDLKNVVLRYYNTYIISTSNFLNGYYINENGQFEGDGEIMYNGQYYKGSVINGERNGRGILIKKNMVYCGYFKNDVPHGRLFCIDMDTDEYYISEWIDGIMAGYGKYYLNNKLKYSGNLIDFEFNGYGVLYDPNGNVEFSGYWKDGIPLVQ